MRISKLLDFCLIFLFLGIVFPYFTVADPLDNWYLRNDLGSDYLRSVSYGNGLFVGIGGSSVWTSPDGTTWTKGNTGVSNTLYQVAFGNGVFVAVGSSGKIITSPDGTVWTSQISRTTNTFSGVAFGNSSFMAIGYPATVVTSPDGATWTLKTPSVSSTFQAKLRYLNSLFMTMGDYWNKVVSSSDGTTWSESPDISDTGWIGATADVDWGDGVYVVVRPGGEIFTSPDLTTWTERTSPGVTTNELYSVTDGNGVFVAVGAYGTIITSPDGIVWTARPSPTSSFLADVTFAEQTFVAVGGDAIQSDPVPEETVSTPTTPNGPANGITDEAYSYSTGGSLSSLAHPVEYQFDWKGDESDLSVWGSFTQSKTWSAAGAYNVRARARCSFDHDVVSSWSPPISVAIFGSGIYVGQDGICGSNNTCYSYIQSGIDSAPSYTIVEITEETYNEDVILDAPKVLILEGGWDEAFTLNSSYTTIDGSVTISSGTMILENIIIK